MSRRTKFRPLGVSAHALPQRILFGSIAFHSRVRSSPVRVCSPHPPHCSAILPAGASENEEKAASFILFALQYCPIASPHRHYYPAYLAHTEPMSVDEHRALTLLRRAHKRPKRQGQDSREQDSSSGYSGSASLSSPSTTSDIENSSEQALVLYRPTKATRRSPSMRPTRPTELTSAPAQTTPARAARANNLPFSNTNTTFAQNAPMHFGHPFLSDTRLDYPSVSDFSDETIWGGSGTSGVRSPGLTSNNPSAEDHSLSESVPETAQPREPHPLIRDAGLILGWARWIGATWPVKWAGRILFWTAMILLGVGFLMAFAMWLFRSGAGTMFQVGSAMFALVGKVSGLMPGAAGGGTSAITSSTTAITRVATALASSSIPIHSADPTSALPVLVPVLDAGSVAGARYLQDKADDLVTASLHLPSVAALASKVFWGGLSGQQNIRDHHIFAKDWVAAASEAADVAEEILHDLYVQFRRETVELSFIVQTAQAITGEVARMQKEDHQTEGRPAAGSPRSSGSSWSRWSTSHDHSPFDRLKRATEHALDTTLDLFAGSVSARVEFLKATDEFTAQLSLALQPDGVVGEPDKVFDEAIAKVDRQFVMAGAGLGWEWGKLDVEGRIRESGNGGYTSPLYDFSQVLTCQEDAKWTEDLHMTHIAGKMCAASFKEAQGRLRKHRERIEDDIKWFDGKSHFLEERRRHLANEMFLAPVIFVADTVANWTAELDHRVQSRYFQTDVRSQWS
ncbi:hypothetical protein QBC47DRAFT_366021 [Echria macrotheca]|uniref:Uncharacterized protein n=1 Tax=Echria macrotheca TaxID=438768 RepID=A0AAJ0B0Z0_9PEZI|nr:hypothetical protein QBC47DRAFT_366021 [Echria macrotheca]